MFRRDRLFRGDRLLQLAEFLKTRVPREQFDMGTWGTEDFAKAWIANKEMIDFRCGTAACALGWAAVLFRDDGLCWQEFTEEDDWVPGGKFVGYNLTLNGDTFEGDLFKLGAEFFGIHRVESFELFDARDRETPEECAERIRAFVAEKRMQESN